MQEKCSEATGEATGDDVADHAFDRISVNGACIKGTPIMVSIVLSCLAAGMSDGEILDEYPSLSVEDIRAAAAYGALLAREQVLPLQAS